MSVKFRLWLLAGLIAALVAAGLFIASGESPQREIESAGPIQWRTSVQCKSCHVEVWNEWLGSHHQIAYLNPEVRQLSDDFRDKACQACHLPRPISITGYGKRTLHRNTLPDEGVSCLTCHLNTDGTILGRTDRPDVPCQPSASADLVSVELCASCHNQHETTDQWRASRFAAAGTDCNSCHMPARPERLGRGHRFDGGHHLETLRAGIRFGLARETQGIVLTLENFGVGHNFPTEERSRAADMLVRFDGLGLDEGWQAVHRLRLPYRSEPLPDTTLPPGETRRVVVPVPAGATAVSARLWYRTTPFASDDDPHSILLFEQRLEELGALAKVEDIAVASPTSPIFAVRLDLARELEAASLRLPREAVVDFQPSSSGLPPLELREMQPVLKELAAELAVPSEADQERLQGLLEAAFLPNRADAELAAFAKQDLIADENALWILEQGLVHEVVEVRSHAAYELGQLQEQAAIPVLLTRLKYWLEDAAPPASVWVADALARLGNYSGLPYLIDWMQRDDTANSAGQSAVEILRAAGIDPGGEPTYADLGKRLAELHGEWLRTGRVANHSAEPNPMTNARMAAHLASLEGFSLRPVDEARYVLSRMGVLAVPLLGKACHASEPFLRTHVLEILRDLGPAAERASDDVLPLLADELSSADAAAVLGSLGNSAAAPHLLPLLRDADPELRAASAGALGPLRFEPAIPALSALLDDEQESLDVRVRAAFSLALLVPAGGARGWLEARREAQDYHVSTLNELLERIDRFKP